MFRHKCTVGVIPIIQGCGQNPLAWWNIKGNGSVKIILDEDIKKQVVDIAAAQFCTTCISIPKEPKATLGIKFYCITIIGKFLHLPFCFEVEVLDSTGMKRRLRGSTTQSSSKITPLLFHFPVSLEEGWNKIQLDLQDMTRRAYNSDFVEFQAMQIYANTRIREVYLSDRWYDEIELPKSYQV